MSGIWEKFEDIVSVDEIKPQGKSDGKIEAGEHNLRLLAVEPTETAGGLPIVKFTFQSTATRQFLNASMFLTNQNYPERTPQAIIALLAVMRKLGNPITFVNMTDLEENINKTITGGVYKIKVTYRNENVKYPNFEVLETISSPDVDFSKGSDGVEEEPEF